MRIYWKAICFALLAVACASTAWGEYVQPQLDKVPIERVLANLADAAADKPKDATLKFNLARAYAMAYATKATDVQVKKGSESPWYGYEPANVPFVAKPAEKKEQEAAAQANLAKAIETYEDGLKIAPDNLVGRLGYAWCLDQAKQKAGAMAEYRKVIAEAWKQEGQLEVAGLGFHSLTAEAGRYLAPLLDKTKDAEEIKDIATKTAKVESIPRPITPIAIPLAEGLTSSDIEDRAAKVRFDADGSGVVKTWSWIKPNAGWLVYDKQGTGEIDSALQLFGNVTFWMFWQHGYEPLAALDDNRDGQLRGSELQGLAIWRDANQNGRSEPGEVKPLSAYDIVALSVRYEVDSEHPDRIEFNPIGVTFTSGNTRATYDLRLHPRP